MGIITGVAIVVLYAHVAPGDDRLRQLHEGREHVLSQDPLRLSVLDLRRSSPSPSSSAMSGSCGSCCAARIPKKPTRPRRAPACESRQPVLAGASRRSSRLSLLGLPIGHAMIGGSILYLFLAGLDMGTAAEQLLNGMYSELRAARHSAVHPRRRVHEHRQHHGAAAALLQRARRPLPRRPRPGQRRAEHHLRQHVGLGARRCRGLRQADADDDDAGRQVHGRASPPR